MSSYANRHHFGELWHSTVVLPPYAETKCPEPRATAEGLAAAKCSTPQKAKKEHMQPKLQQQQDAQPQQHLEPDQCLKAPKVKKQSKPQEQWKQPIQEPQQQQSQEQQPQQRFQSDKSKQQVMNRFREELRHVLPLAPQDRGLYILAMLKELKAWAKRCKKAPAHSDSRKGFQAETKLLWDVLANIPLTTEDSVWILELVDTFAQLVRWNWPLGNGIEAAPFLAWFRQCLQQELHLALGGSAQTRLWFSFGKLCKLKLPAATKAAEQKEEGTKPQRKPAAPAKSAKEEEEEEKEAKQLGAVAKALSCFASLTHRIRAEHEAVTQEDAKAVARQLGECWGDCEAVKVRRATLLQVAHGLLSDLVLARLLATEGEAVVREVEFAQAVLQAVDNSNDWREANLPLAMEIARRLHSMRLVTNDYRMAGNALKRMLPESKRFLGPDEELIQYVATLE